MTNSPIFSEQLALDKYWKQIGGTVMLPGTNRAADHFARASFMSMPFLRKHHWKNHWPVCSASFAMFP